MRSIRQFAWFRWALAVAALLTGVNCGSDRARFVARDVQASPMARLTLRVAAHAWLDLAARDAQHGARAVLHLWDVESRVEVARDRGTFWGGAAHVRYQNPRSVPRTY